MLLNSDESDFSSAVDTPFYCFRAIKGSGFIAATPTTHIEDVLRLIRAQNVHCDLLAVGQADVQSHFLCGNLLRLLWEERSCKILQDVL